MSRTIEYRDTLAGITPAQLAGFFEGWPNPPTSAQHLRILQGSTHVVLAVDSETGQVIGFMNALADGVLSAFLPLLEVLPAHRGQGIGRELVRRMFEQLADYRCIDLCCDANVRPFYERFGMTAVEGMILRRPEKTAPSK